MPTSSLDKSTGTLRNSLAQSRLGDRTQKRTHFVGMGAHAKTILLQK
jgi:hypothetical protein